MKKRIKIPEEVLSFLQCKGVAVQKDVICKVLGLSRVAVNRACSLLRKAELIGMFRTHVKNLNEGSILVKTYWSAKI